MVGDFKAIKNSLKDVNTLRVFKNCTVPRVFLPHSKHKLKEKIHILP